MRGRYAVKVERTDRRGVESIGSKRFIVTTEAIPKEWVAL
jgi:hypothetical protein